MKQVLLSDSKLGLEIKIGERIDLMQVFLGVLEREQKDSYTRDELRIWFTNTIYNSLEGTHAEKISRMTELDIPSSTKNTQE